MKSFDSFSSMFVSKEDFPAESKTIEQIII